MSLFAFVRTLPLRERRYVIAVIAAVLVLSSAPYLIGWMRQGSADRFLGVDPINTADTAVYLSFMRQAAHGRVFVENMHTAEAQTGSIFHPLWLVLGWVSGVFCVPPPIVYHLARVAVGGALLLAVYAFLLRMFASVRTRVIAFALIAFSSGFGWVVSGISMNDPEAIQLLLPTDRWVSESNTFLTLFHSPLFPLSQLLILAVFWYWMDERRHRSFVFPAALYGLLAVVHPYDTIPVLAVCGVAMLVQFFRDPTHPVTDLLRQVRRMFLLLLFAVPPLLQFLVAAHIEPAIGGWVKQNQTLSPPLSSYLFGYGALVPLAVLGWALLRRTRSPRMLFLLSWVTTNAVLLYAPVQVNRRFSNGFHIALSMLAAVGIAAIVGWWERRPQTLRRELLGHAGVWVGVLVLFLSNLIMLGTALYWLGKPIGRSISYMPVSVDDALRWLDRTAPPETIVLSPNRYGNTLPSVTGLRSYIGHGHQTIDFEAKRALVQRFFWEPWTPAGRERFLRSQDIAYILVHDDHERVNLEREPYLRRVFVEGATEVYAVEGVR